MYKSLYQQFLNAHPKTLHFAAHSHHYWPDVSRKAHIQYWDDSCKFVDDKWSMIFSKKIPQAQKLIAKNLNLDYPEQIVFAPNTHEFVMRLFSCLPRGARQIVLTTDSEFYSFDRQASRLAENPQDFEVHRIPTAPYQDFSARFVAEAQRLQPQLIFLSHVFFNSAWVAPIEEIIPQLPNNSIVVIDGYHSFMAVPVDLKPFQDRIYFMSGSYKYAQGGEGCCFLYSPKNSVLRPEYTGWFAEIGSLANKNQAVGYPEDGMRFAGSTMDFSALYRLIAVLQEFESQGLTQQHIHDYIQKLQKSFVKKIESLSHPHLQRKSLLLHPWEQQGHFLTFELPDEQVTSEVVKDLRAKGIWTDSRKNRIRFGFGLYLTEEDIQNCQI